MKLPAYLSHSILLPARRRGAFACVVIVSLSLLISASVMSHSAQAQDNAEGIPGEVISQGEAPFSQTLPQMLKQDEPAQRLRRSGMRLPKAERVVPNVLGEELEDALPNRILPRVDRQSRVFFSHSLSRIY